MGSTCSVADGTMEPITTQRLPSTDGEPNNDSNDQQIRAMSEQIIFLSTQNARLTQQLEEMTLKLRNAQNQNQNENQSQNQDENKILSKHNIDLFSFYEMNYTLHKYKIKIDKKKDRTLPNSISTHIINIFQINHLTKEKENLLREILDNSKDDIIVELILRLTNEKDSNGVNLKLLSKLILKKIIISWKTQQNTKIDLDFVHEIGRNLGESDVVNAVNQIVEIIQNEDKLTTQFNQLCDF